MSTSVGFLMIAVGLSVLGGTALWYFTNRSRRTPDLPPVDRSPSVPLAQREPSSGIRVIGVDDDEKRGRSTAS